MPRPKIIIFRREENVSLLDYVKSADSGEVDLDQLPYELEVCYSFKELGSRLLTNPVLVIGDLELIRNHGSVEEFLLMIETLIKFSGCERPPKVGIGVCKSTTQEELRQIQKSSPAGIFPKVNEFGFEEFDKAVITFLETGKSWPKQIIEQIVGNKRKPKFKNVHLTGRQQQVYDLIAQRGLSNKQIAQVLKISESTVKIHVSAVMRALCVRNRTQLALTK